MTMPIDILVKASATALGGVTLWLIKSGVQAVVQLRDDVRDLKYNHIPHLQEAIEELREAIHELTKRIH